MANCDDLTAKQSSDVEGQEVWFSKTDDINNVTDMCIYADQKKVSIENVKTSVMGQVFDTDDIFFTAPSNFEKTNTDEYSNENKSIFVSKEIVEINQLASKDSSSSIVSNAFPSTPSIIDEIEAKLIGRPEVSTINTECNVQISSKHNTENPLEISVQSTANEKSSQDPIRKQGIPNMNRTDCRVIFSSKDNSCLIENTSISEVSNKSRPINNNFAQTVNKENEFVIESTESEDYSVDTVLPLSKSCNTIGSKKKRSKESLSSRGRRVSFPEDDTSLITSYLEPVNPWVEMFNVNHDDIINAYRASCGKHGTSPLPAVLQQIFALPLVVGGRIQCLNFRNQKLDSVQCECLEEVFRRVQFKMLNFESCSLDDDSVIPLFDMIEFYDSATQINISCNVGIGSRGWQMFAKMLKKSQSIELVDAHSTNLCEETVPILSRILRQDTKLQTLHLENCNLTERPLVTLSGALRLNETLRELYLADNHIGPKDCIQLENLLADNTTLKTLDLRNNNIQDEGCEHLCKGLQLQQLHIDKATTDTVVTQAGLKNLVLWNNHLTFASVSSIASTMFTSNSLQTLNLGKNNLTSEGMIAFQSFLLKNKSIANFGLQATRMEDEGIISLAECLAGNNTLQRIDLRENNIKAAGLSALASVLANVNKTVVKIDIDCNTTLTGDEDVLYTSMKIAISESCRKNHTNSHVFKELVESHQISDKFCLRKGSLTCETPTVAVEPVIEVKRYFSPEPSPCPSPSPSPIPSPVNSRFRVCKTPDNFLSVNPSPPVLSTSAPASLTIPPECSRSTPLLSSSVKDRYRFKVTKVSEGSRFPSKTMSAPSLTIPNNYHQSETIIVIPSSKIKGIDTFIPQNDTSPPDDVFFDVSISDTDSKTPLQRHSKLLKAPLAAMEGESFDTDSEESEAKSDIA